MAPDLVALQQEIDRLQAQRAELQPIVRELRARTDRLQGLIDDVRRGILFGMGRRAFLLILVVTVAALGVIGYALLHDDGSYALEKRRLNRVSSSLEPHLLVTSEPSGASVQLNGAKAGKTPFVHAAPKNVARRFTVDLQASGYRPARRIAQTDGRRGAHLHVVLAPRSPAKKPAVIDVGADDLKRLKRGTAKMPPIPRRKRMGPASGR